MAHGKVIERALSRQHVTELDLTSALRRAGVTRSGAGAVRDRRADRGAVGAAGRRGY